MSERMIEMQRARLGLPPSGGPGMQPSGATQNVTPSVLPGHSPLAVAPQKNITQQAAVAAQNSEDQQMQRFIHRLQRRDDSQQTITDSRSSCGPTVPTALSRRMLQRQGVGYLDNTVAAMASAAGDRFLATVLNQAIACRNQRLEGSEQAREAAKQRKRHMEQYQADVDDRRRRRKIRAEEREKANLAAIEAAEAITKGGSASGAKDGETKSKKKKKPPAAAAADTTNGKKTDPTKKSAEDDDDDDDSFDSMDEEEQQYQQFYGTTEDNDEESDYEEDDTLMLIDVTRPLEAWDFSLTGKLGMTSAQDASEDAEGDETKDEDAAAQRGADDLEDNSGQADAAGAAADSKGENNKAIEDGISSPTKRDANATSAPSPTSNP